VEHRIEITRVTHSAYAVTYQGERIGQWLLPTCDGARWLLVNGKAERSDTLIMCREGRPAMRGGVGWFADRTVTENEKVSPRWSKWRPFVALPANRPATVCGSAAGGRFEELVAEMPLAA
jgi:hypothetical protein